MPHSGTPVDRPLDGPPTTDADLQAIERAGASAAAAGQPATSNPYLRPQNMPDVTGEPLEHWTRMQDAWHDGFERARREAPGPRRKHKEQAGPALLRTLVSRRLRWVPMVRLELERPGAVLRLSAPTAHPADGRGRTWDIDDFRCGELDAARCAEMFRSIVDRVRDEFDLR